MSYRIMVVDDQMFMRLSLTQLIKEMGWEKVGEASNGKEAIEMYPVLKPDLVLMDITMPLVNGLDALKVLMKYDPQARIVMLTAIGQESEITRAMELGAANYVLKPYKKDELAEVIERALSKVKVLIADDELSRRTFLARVIEESGCELVGSAAQGQEAVEMYFKLKPDILLMDITMPIMDGLSAFKRIKLEDPSARVVMLAEAAQTSAINKAMEVGAKHVLIKPFQKADLNAAIEGVLVQVKILVVDDQVFLRRLLTRLIGENGWTVVGGAANGKEAVEMYSELKPDIVMMDVTMPVMDGIEALKAIKQSDPKARVIMVSDAQEKEKVEAAMQAGAKAYVLKPFEDVQVIAEIRRLASLIAWEKLRNGNKKN
ncbi:MAG TPA: response regulator [Chroococcales cyanobacterium]